MKKLLWTSSLLTLLLVACGENDEVETEEVESPEIATEEVAVDETDSEENAETMEEDTLIGALTDADLITIEDYDATKWTYADLSPLGTRIENEVFVEENRLYIGTQANRMMALDADYNLVWENVNQYGYHVSIAIDDTQAYNPSLGGKRSDGDSIKVLSKDSGEMAYEIDISEYAETSEILLDDEAIYLVLGKMIDPEDGSHAEDMSLHKFDKTNGQELWALEIDGVRLAGGRSHHYELTQSDDFIYLVEKEDEDNQILVARSKEDGSEVWSEPLGERDDAARFGRTYVADDSVTIIDNTNTFHVFDEITGKKQAEYAYDGVVPGGEVPFPLFYEDLVIWQDVTEDYHHLKAVQPKEEVELWTLDMDGHFLVDYKMVDDILYAFFGSIDYDAEHNTLMARIDPQTGEIMDLVDLGESISRKYNNYYRFMGLTEHQGQLAFFNDNHLFIFNE